MRIPIPTDSVQLARRFAYHEPPHDGIKNAHQTVRQLVGTCADDLNEILPESREKSLVFTHLEEAMMWANAAIARDPLGVGEEFQPTNAHEAEQSIEAPEGGAEQVH